MKTTLLTLSLLFTINAHAKDMSRTETYDESYREQEDGSNEYIGGCSVHQDYEGKLFTVTKTIVESYEPEYNAPAEETMKKLKHVEVELLTATATDSTETSLAEFFSGVDDFTLEKISHKKFKGLDLYRWNIGVGGGNGYYEVYNRTEVKGQVKYEKLSNIFDGDVEFCDSKIWLKK